jgi:hypothetical protein
VAESSAMEDIVKEMASYKKVLEEKAFTKHAAFLDRYGSGWDGLKLWKQEIHSNAAAYYNAQYGYGGVKMGSVTPLELEKAKPFIRAVIERMLDLMQSEENWVKGTEHKITEDGVEQFCLIGAQARALSDLGLKNLQAEEEVELQRKKVLRSVEEFLRETLKAETGLASMPGFNDSKETTFEDVRLWLKTCLSKLED